MSLEHFRALVEKLAVHPIAHVVLGALLTPWTGAGCTTLQVPGMRDSSHGKKDLPFLSYNVHPVPKHHIGQVYSFWPRQPLREVLATSGAIGAFHE